MSTNSQIIDELALALYNDQVKRFPESHNAKKHFYEEGFYHAAARVMLGALVKTEIDLGFAGWEALSPKDRNATGDLNFMVPFKGIITEILKT